MKRSRCRSTGRSWTRTGLSACPRAPIMQTSGSHSMKLVSKSTNRTANDTSTKKIKTRKRKRQRNPKRGSKKVPPLQAPKKAMAKPQPMSMHQDLCAFQIISGSSDCKFCHTPGTFACTHAWLQLPAELATMHEKTPTWSAHRTDLLDRLTCWLSKPLVIIRWLDSESVKRECLIFLILKCTLSSKAYMACTPAEAWLVIDE